MSERDKPLAWGGGPLAAVERAMKPHQQSEWRPIASAPKGKTVIVGNDSGWMAFCYQTDNGEGFLDTWRYAFTNRGEQAPWPTRWKPAPPPDPDQREAREA